jgi:hypothetical protein
MHTELKQQHRAGIIHACILSAADVSLQLASLAAAGVLLVDWSRTGSFITTAVRPGKGPDGQPVKNIKVTGVAVRDVWGCDVAAG